MKKKLLIMLLAGVLTPAIAQEIVPAKMRDLQAIEVTGLEIPPPSMLPVNQSGSLVDVGLWEYSGISQKYDRQSQGAVYPMTMRHDNGFIGSTWTNEDNPPFPGVSTNPTRGIGYSYSTNGGQTWSVQENRVGGIPIFWPSYAQWGTNGEAILGRSSESYEYQGVQIINGLVLLTRPNKGQGAWTITPVPYPAGTSPGDGFTMTWARMTTSGSNHQYIHIMSPMITPASQPYQEYSTPVLYYRTQAGSLSWDIQGKLVPDMLGEQWSEKSYYCDAITFAVQGNTVACSFISAGSHGYVIKSLDNGDTWESIKFYDSPVLNELTLADYGDTVYVPRQGCIALDKNGKIHVAFSILMVKNSNTGNYTFFRGLLTSFLSYWSEDMAPIDGAAEFVKYEIDIVLDELFGWNENLYVKSLYPKWPIIGYYTPLHYPPMFTINDYDGILWAGSSYNNVGMFSFPQMTFDSENRVRLAYLGLVDYGASQGRWIRHPFYTVSYDGGLSWTKTDYLVNSLDYVDKEFAYLTLAGFDGDKMYLMAQVDQTPGTHIAGDHSATNNYFLYITVGGAIPPPPPPPPPACNSVTNITAVINDVCKSATINWNEIAGAKGYTIRRNGKFLNTVSATTYTDDFNFVNGTTYKYTIKTLCNTNTSRVVSVSATANCEVCNPITNANAIIENCETAIITWNAVVGAKEYEIRRDGNLLGSVTTPSFTENAVFEHGNSYTWKIKTICDKSESTEVSISTTASCESITELSNSIAICPNPTSGTISITAKNFLKLEVYNPVGQLIETKTVNIFDISSYNTGIYFFKIFDVNNNCVTKRVMVVR